jgi:hypothetical protein
MRPDHGANGDFEKAHRIFSLGDLATLVGKQHEERRTRCTFMSRLCVMNALTCSMRPLDGSPKAMAAAAGRPVCSLPARCKCSHAQCSLCGLPRASPVLYPLPQLLGGGAPARLVGFAPEKPQQDTKKTLPGCNASCSFWGLQCYRILPRRNTLLPQLLPLALPPLPLLWPLPGPSAPLPLPLLWQVLVENRLSERVQHVDMPATRFYAETAKKDMREWDQEAILQAKEDLCRELLKPHRTMIGGCGAQAAP